MNEQGLYDTGFLLATLNDKDVHHESCSLAYALADKALLPEIVLPELAFLVIRDLGYQPLIDFLRSVAIGDFTLVKTELQDLERAAEVLEKYADSKIDFVDCVIVAIAERLDIKRILTVDRRHFGLFRPVHTDYFEILP